MRCGGRAWWADVSYGGGVELGLQCLSVVVVGVVALREVASLRDGPRRGKVGLSHCDFYRCDVGWQTKDKVPQVRHIHARACFLAIQILSQADSYILEKPPRTLEEGPGDCNGRLREFSERHHGPALATARHHVGP